MHHYNQSPLQQPGFSPNQAPTSPAVTSPQVPQQPLYPENMHHYNQSPLQQPGFSPNQAPTSPAVTSPQVPQQPLYPAPQPHQNILVPTYDPKQIGHLVSSPQPPKTCERGPPMFDTRPSPKQQPTSEQGGEISTGTKCDNTIMRYYFQSTSSPAFLSTSGTGGKGLFKVHTAFSKASVRAAFVRKVFCLVTVMLLVISTMCSVPFWSKDVKMFLRRPLGPVRPDVLFYSSLLFYFVISYVIACTPCLRRTFPKNIFTIAILTLSLGFMTMTICSLYNGESVLLTLISTTASCLGIIIFSMQTRFDLTRCLGILIVTGWCLLAYGITAAIAFVLFSIHWLYLIYALLGMLFIMIYLVIDTQIIIGRRRHEVSPEEYIQAAIWLFTDIVTIFIFLLQLFSSRQ